MDECNLGIWFSGVGATIIGFGLGYLPQWCSGRAKVRAYKANLSAEVEKCKEMALAYQSDNITSPSYRLPITAWNTAYPKLIELTDITEQESKIINQFYIEVDSLNRGLDQINAARYIHGGGQIRNEELPRNLLKASNITNSYEETLTTIKQIK